MGKVSLEFSSEQIVEMVKDALENPVPPLPKADVDLQVRNVGSGSMLLGKSVVTNNIIAGL